MQSVAHMPMKAMIYKTLSTVVDDFFAYVYSSFENFLCLTHLVCRFCIKMPFLHRLACFRDDLVFLVFLYQVRLNAYFPCQNLVHDWLLDLFSGGFIVLTRSVLTNMAKLWLVMSMQSPLRRMVPRRRTMPRRKRKSPDKEQNKYRHFPYTAPRGQTYVAII